MSTTKKTITKTKITTETIEIVQPSPTQPRKKQKQHKTAAPAKTTTKQLNTKHKIKTKQKLAAAVKAYRSWDSSTRDTYNAWAALADAHSSDGVKLNRHTVMRACTEGLVTEREHSQKLLTAEQEQQLAARIREYGASSNPLSAAVIVTLVNKFLTDHSITGKGDNGRVGKEWITRFMTRWDLLNVKPNQQQALKVDA